MGKPLRSRRLRHRVTIERRTETRDRFGAVRSAWTTHAERAADVETPTGREPLVADQRRSELSHVLTVRAPLDVTTADRLVFNGRTLGIIAVYDRDNHGRELTILAVEAPAHGATA